MDRLSDYLITLTKIIKKEENKIKNTNQVNNVVKRTNSMFEVCTYSISLSVCKM